ncbi:hypothetical protein Mpsy_1553 [Methanolobus psychrophilus R15]|nr:hypothetical protein Mpsy_1553 [Methanolobus psychrophilus R15]
MTEQGKITSFRLPDEILVKLDKLQANGFIKDRTDGVIKGIEHLYKEKEVITTASGFLNMLKEFVKYPSIIINWDKLSGDSDIHTVNEYGGYDRIHKLGKEHAKIYRSTSDENIVVTITAEHVGVSEMEGK